MTYPIFSLKRNHWYHSCVYGYLGLERRLSCGGHQWSFFLNDIECFFGHFHPVWIKKSYKKKRGGLTDVSAKRAGGYSRRVHQFRSVLWCRNLVYCTCTVSIIWRLAPLPTECNVRCLVNPIILKYCQWYPIFHGFSNDARFRCALALCPKITEPLVLIALIIFVSLCV